MGKARKSLAIFSGSYYQKSYFFQKADVQAMPYSGMGGYVRGMGG
jgi:hypothetical protein